MSKLCSAAIARTRFLRHVAKEKRFAETMKSSQSDIGHILENIVFLELKRRGYDVYVGHLDNGVIDFVVANGDDISYYQVSAMTLDENVLNRERALFKRVGDNYPKYLLTFDTADYNGINNRMFWSGF